MFRALGDGEPPQAVAADDKSWQLIEVYKHDSWAATAVYGSGDGARIVCKFNRVAPIFFIPMAWLGKRLARRELWFLRHLADIDGIPKAFEVSEAAGGLLPNVSAHEFVEGGPFRGRKDAHDTFFDQLDAMIGQLHRRGVAYVDLHKMENIIVDPEGRPNLIDFQVSFALSERWPGNGMIARKILKTLMNMDRYHIDKHFARCRPDLLSPQEVKRMLEPPPFVRWHRRIAVPLRSARRKLLVALGIRSGEGMARSEYNPEIAFRDEKERGKNGRFGPEQDVDRRR